MRRRYTYPNIARAAAGLLLVTALLPGCIHLPDQQSARILDEGQWELTPSYSRVSVSFEGDSEHVGDQYGLHFGLGLSEQAEFRGMYQRVTEPGAGDDDANLLGAGVKVSLVEDVLALNLPIGFMFGDGIESSDTWTVAPTVLATWRAAPTFELNPSIKAIYPFAVDDPELLLGFHLGAALSADLDRWAVRPEIGATINPGEEGTVWGWTLGFSFRP